MLRIEIQRFADGGFKWHVMAGEAAIASSPIVTHREAFDQSLRLLLGGVRIIIDETEHRPNSAGGATKQP